VIGVDSTGRPIEFALDARDADEAEHQARARGINVAKVWLGASASASTPVPAAPLPIAAKPRIAPPNPSPAPRAAAPITPVQPSPYNRAPARPRINLGLISLSLGGIALLFVWIPTVGLISWPLCAIGLLAGIAGTALACRRTASYAPSLVARLAPPLGGLTLSVLTIAAGAVFAGASAPDEAASTTTSPDHSASTTSAPDRKPRNLAIVASSAAHTTNLDTLTNARPKPTVEIPPIQPIKLGAAELRIVSCETMIVPLVGDKGRPAGSTAMPLMVIRVEIRNTGESPIAYTTLAGDSEAGLKDGATLKDDLSRTVRRAQFGFSIVPAGRAARETLFPGKSVTDVLVFEAPASPPAFLTLEASGRCVGTAGSGQLTVPAPVAR